jgi:hypothetical protein
VPVRERVTVFDNDGTLWCEKPMPIRLDFILRRLAEMAEGIRPAYTPMSHGDAITRQAAADCLDDAHGPPHEP